MRKPLLLLALFSALVLPAAQSGAQTVVTAGNARVIVKYKADSPLLRKAFSVAAEHAERAQALGARVGVSLRSGAGVAERTQVVFAAGMTSAELAQRLAAESDIEYAVPDERRHYFAVPNDPLYLTGPPVVGTTGGPAAGQWYLRAPTGTVASSINVEQAWNVTTGSPSIVVAVIDTGVRFDHPDLRPVAAGGNLLPGYDMISDADVANDGDGRDPDASDPGDWLTDAEINARGGPFEQCGNSARDSSWHGTQTSGLIGALTNNGIGIASVGRNVRVLPVRVLGKCGGYDSDIVAGMRWAAGLPVPGVPANPNPARVLNLSLGGEGTCGAAYLQAVAEINAVGAVVVAAAGNSAGHAVQLPGNCAGVIAVAALRHVGTKVGFSDLGPQITVSAPGGNCVNVGADDACLYPIATLANAGLTTPIADAAGGSIYTDSFNISVGTSFSAPLVSGTVALMLSARPSLTPTDVRNTLRSTARLFPTTSSDGSALLQCTAPQSSGGTQIDQLECLCTTTTCGGGMLDAGAAVLAAAGPKVSAVPNYQGLWWNWPAASEAGWGINFAHQGDTIFATWFTYDLDGKPLWMAVSATRTAPGVYSGDLFRTTGPAFSAIPFDPNAVVETPLGTATFTFTDDNNGSFLYIVNGAAQIKNITRQVFASPAPSCVWGGQPETGVATNYQDLWWKAPAASESGWGLAVTHQGDTIFAVWFTYGLDGKPLWLAVSAQRVAEGVYSGSLFTATGPAYNAVPFNPANEVETTVGTATLTFTTASTATFAYSVNGVAQSKNITRQVFVAPGTLCQ